MAAVGYKKQQVSLKIVVHKYTNKVLFAEAGKDFVDVLFSFLTLPLGTIVRLVGEKSAMQLVKVGSLSSLYQSVTDLCEDCLWIETCKEMLLQPRNSMEDYCRSLNLNIDDTEPTKYYVCANLECCRRKTRVMCSTFKNKKCGCGDFLAKPFSPVGSIVFSDMVKKLVLDQPFFPQSSKISNVVDGFVMNNVSFLITDELNVLPNSYGTVFSLLKNFGIENLSSVDEMTVNITKNKVMDLLKCSLLSKTVLTDVFLGKKVVNEKYELARFSPSDFSAKDSDQINVKLVYQKSDRKVLFVQGKEDFADFLLSFLTFPLGGVVRLLEGYSSLGSVDGLYKSIVDLNEDYFKTKEAKDKLVDLGLAPQFKLTNQIIPFCEADAPKYNYHYKSQKYYELFMLTTTSESWKGLDMVDPISKTESAKGFAKGPSMYVATDDLVLTPLSSISFKSLLRM